MKKIPQISETEWRVMKVVWANRPSSAADIIAELERLAPGWHLKTARALINRLMVKKALGFRKEGRAYVYQALAKEEDCVESAGNSFLERVFGRSLKSMFAHFMQRKKLPQTEIEELERLLDK